MSPETNLAPLSEMPAHSNSPVCDACIMSASVPAPDCACPECEDPDDHEFGGPASCRCRRTLMEASESVMKGMPVATGDDTIDAGRAALETALDDLDKALASDADPHGEAQGWRRRARVRRRLEEALANEGPSPHRGDRADAHDDVAIAKAYVPIEKADPLLGIIFGRASVADVFDRQGHRIRADQLERAAYSFMAKANKHATDTHGPIIPGTFVASWVEDGIWRIGFKPDDINIAKAAADGDFVGFSIGGVGRLVPVEV